MRSRSTSERLRRLGLWAWVLACAALTPARAEVWAFIDERGVPHFAGHRVDDRYQLFFKGSAPEMLAQPLPAPTRPSAAPARAGVLANDGAAGAAGGLQSDPEPVSARPRLLGFLERSPSYRQMLPMVEEVARQLGLDVHLMVALIAAESGFNPRAVSPKGAVGLMQLMPATAQRYGVRDQAGVSQMERLMLPEVNLRAGAAFLRDLLLMFPNRLDLALAAYNAGPGAVQRAGHRIPNYPETQNYVRVVTQLLGHLKPPAPWVPDPLPAAVAPPVAPPAAWLAPSMAGAVARGILLAPSGVSMPAPGTALQLPEIRD